MPPFRSRTCTRGGNMTGARAIWRATGMTDSDVGTPIVAIANPCTQFVPGHVHLEDMGGLIASAAVAAGGVAKEFNTIAMDGGIAMGHAGMLDSLPTRELIADWAEHLIDVGAAQPGPGGLPGPAGVWIDGVVGVPRCRARGAAATTPVLTQR